MHYTPATCPTRAPQQQPATSAVIFLHGYGADGNDLLNIADVWAQALPNTVFASPNAPQPCMANPFGGRQWFPLFRFDEAELWDGVNAAAPELNEFLESFAAHYGLPMDKIALVGFSQGTMMALHVALRREHAPCAVVGFSGRLVGAQHLANEAISSPALFLAHGDADSVVPYISLQHALETLESTGRTAHTYTAHNLGHGIDEQMLVRAGQFLVAQLS